MRFVVAQHPQQLDLVIGDERIGGTARGSRRLTVHVSEARRWLAIDYGLTTRPDCARTGQQGGDMAITDMNHAVMYVGDARRTVGLR